MLACIITAGGFGSRFKSSLPKQYHKINGEFILQKTIDAFKLFAERIVVVIRKEDEEFFKANFTGISYVFGGISRQASVLNGLEYLKQFTPSFVLITDGVRPFASHVLIMNIIKELKNGEIGVVPCIKMQDTIKRVKDGYVVKTENREELYATQTPQGFVFDTIFMFHVKHKDENFTDDASILEEEGMKVKVIEGEKTNIKITTQEDLK